MKKLLFVSIVLYLCGCTVEDRFVEPAGTSETPQALAAADVERAISLVEDFSKRIKASDTRRAHAPLSNISLTETKKVEIAPSTRSSLKEVLLDSMNIYTFELEMGNKKGFAIASGNPHIGDVYAFVEDGEVSDTIFNKGMAEMIASIPVGCQLKLEEYNHNPETTATRFEDYEPTIINPLVWTQWGQGYPYNAELPAPDCPSGYFPAGCGPIATCQALVYYQVRCLNNFNHNNIHSVFSGFINNKGIKQDFSMMECNLTPRYPIYPYVVGRNIQIFIKNVNTYLKSSKSCSGTGVFFKDCLQLISVFGLQAYPIGGVFKHSIAGNIYTINDEAKYYLSMGNIIVAKGLDKYGAGGHMWIVDGYYEISASGGVYEGLIHCNWGWAGRSDGWYKGTIHNKPVERPYEFSYEDRYYALRYSDPRYFYFSRSKFRYYPYPCFNWDEWPDYTNPVLD